MYNYFILLIIPLTAFFLRNILLKKKILINLSGDFHQKFANKEKVPLIGGLLIFISFSYLYFFDLSFEFYFFIFLIFILGLLSDLKIFKSPFLKLIIQILIICFMANYSDLKLNNIGINFIDNFNKNIFFNYLFVSFCIIIIVNGSNFIDGINGLSLGYFILVLIMLIQKELFLSELDLNYIFLISLFIIFIFNLRNFLFLGDNGSYILGALIGYILIEVYNQNEVSPFFIVLLLWYPSFELLFSMIRKFNFKKSPMKPDTSHLHQLIYLFILKKYFKKSLISNIFTGLIINCYNMIIFLIASFNYLNSEIQILLISISIFIYIILYRNLIK